MSFCIYPHKGDPGESTNEYHIHPYSSGNQKQLLSLLDEYILPKGLVCDQCNNYFGKGIEKEITNHPYIKQCNAFYGRRTRREKIQTFLSEGTKIYRSESGSRVIEGTYKIYEDGRFIFPLPSIKDVNNRLVSRAIHKIGYEFFMLEIYKKYGVEHVKRIAKAEPYQSMAKYIKEPLRHEYRPYGVEASGATRVAICSMYMDNNDGSLENIFNDYVGFIIGFPGARFSCVLSARSGRLKEMIDDINKYSIKGYLTTSTIIDEP